MRFGIAIRVDKPEEMYELLLTLSYLVYENLT
jgi:hypothetical protein